MSELEDILKDKFSEAEYPFDEANWEKAEGMISSMRLKALITKGAALFSGGLLFGAILMTPFIFDKDEDPITEQKQTIENVEERIIVQPNKTHVESISKQTRNEVPISEAEEKTPTPKENLIVSKPTKRKSLSTNYIKTTPSNPILKKVEFASIKPIVIHESDGPTSDITDPAATIKSESKPLPPKKNAIISEENVDIKPTNDRITEIQKRRSIQEAYMDSLQNEVSILRETVALLENKQELADSLKTEREKRIAKRKKKKNEKEKQQNNDVPKTWNLFVAFGGNYVNDFSLNTIQGFEATVDINDKWAASIGLHYTFLKAEKDITKTILTAEAYTFGYNADITTIKTNTLNYAMMPLFATYKLNDNNAFMLGANIYKLISVSNTLNSYTAHYGHIDNSSPEKVYGYSTGINPFDIGLMAGYQRSLFGNFGISLRINYGLMDIQKNSYYQNQTFERNLSGQFMLNYKLR